MHHVASDTKAAAGRHLPPHLPRAADRAPRQPFASLIDDPPPAAPPPNHTAKHDDTARTERPHAAHRTSDSKTDKPVKKAADDSKTDKPAKKAANDNKDKAASGSDAPGKTTDSAKTASDANAGKSKDDTDAGDPAKSADDGKTTADASKSDVPAGGDSCAPPSTSGPTADVGIAVTTLPQDQTPEPQGAAAGGSGPDPTLPELAVLQTGNGKADDPTIPQDAKPDDAAKPQDAELPTDTDGKPPVATKGPDKPVPTNGKGDASPPAHHAKVELPPVQTGDPGVAAKAANGNQPLTLPSPPSHATASTTPAANQAALAQPAAVPLAGVAIEIAGKALAGKNRFEIRLDPPELGRIDVRLDVDRNGHVTSHLTVDRPETLNLLRQDSASLERALQDAGLKTSDNGLQFSLRDQSMSHDRSQSSAPGAAHLVVEDDALAATASTQHRHSRIAGMGGGVDIRV